MLRPFSMRNPTDVIVSYSVSISSSDLYHPSFDHSSNIFRSNQLNIRNLLEISVINHINILLYTQHLTLPIILFQICLYFIMYKNMEMIFISEKDRKLKKLFERKVYIN